MLVSSDWCQSVIIPDVAGMSAENLDKLIYLSKSCQKLRDKKRDEEEKRLQEKREVARGLMEIDKREEGVQNHAKPSYICECTISLS